MKTLIEKALMNIGDATNCAMQARDAWIDEDWVRCVECIDFAMGKLASAALYAEKRREDEEDVKAAEFDTANAALTGCDSRTVERRCSALALARQFHATYERLAPSLGYETRPETRAFDPDSPNGRLMIAVCVEIIEQNAALRGCEAVPSNGVVMPTSAELIDFILSGAGCNSARDTGGYYHEKDECGLCVYCRLKSARHNSVICVKTQEVPR